MINSKAPALPPAHPHSHPARGARAALAAVAVAALSLVGLATAAPAQAAPLTATFSNQQLLSGGNPVTEAKPFTSLRFQSDFSLSAEPQAGDTFFVPLDLTSGDFGISDTSFVLNNASGVAAADCVYSEADLGITCTFRSPIPAGTGSEGNIWFQVSMRSEEVGDTVRLNVADVFFDVLVLESGGGTGPIDQPDILKSGANFSGTPGVVDWSISLRDEEIARFGQMSDIVIVDKLTTGVTDQYIFMPQVYVTDSVMLECRAHLDAGGAYVPGFIVSTSDYTITWAATSFEMTIDPAVLSACAATGTNEFVIRYKTSIPGGVILNDPTAPRPWYAYGNEAQIDGETYSSQVVRQASGGGGIDAGQAIVLVEKSLEGDAAALVSGQTFTVSVASAAGSYEVPVTIGAPSSLGSFAINSPITLSEVNLPVIDGVEWGDYTFTGAGLTDNGDGTWTFVPTAGGQTISLGLVNSADSEEVPEPELGSLTVSKVVVGDDAPAGVEYAFEVTCSDSATPRTGTAAAGSSFTVTDIPAGADCAVVETTAHGADSIAYSAENVTIVADGTAEVTVTNTFDEVVVEPEVGSLTVSKVVVGDDAPAGVEYAFEVTCSDSTTPRTGTAAAGSSFTVTDIPAGADCAVVETAAHGADSIAYSAENVTIVADGTAEVTVTNTFDEVVVEPEVGSLTVSKVVVGDDAPAGVEYAFEVTCSGVATPFTGTAVAGSSFTVTDIPAGADCAVVETAAHGADSIAYSAENVTIVADETATVTVTNTFDEVPPTDNPEDPENPTTQPKPEGPKLATTGDELNLAPIAIGSLLLLAGLAAVGFRRRTRA